MKKALTIVLLATIVAATCDPDDVDCIPQENMPRKYIGKWWMYGILSWMRAITPFIINFVYASIITELGVAVLAYTYTVGALNFIGFVPAGIFWIFTVIGGDKYTYTRYRGWLIASNIYGWLLSVINITWYIVLILYVLIFHTWTGN